MVMKEFELNTGVDGILTIETPKAEGKVDAILIKSKTQVEIAIESELGYKLLHLKQLPNFPKISKEIKTFYFVIRHDAIDCDGNRIPYSPAPYNLEEKLKITVIGPANTEIKVIFKFL